MNNQIEELMRINQPLKAWELVKNTNHPLKQDIYMKVKHAFEPSAYDKFYKEDLKETPFPLKFAYGCDRIVPRFSWLIDKIIKDGYQNILDIGCADGYLGLTLATLEILSVGLNLYQPSIDIANERAKRRNLNFCKFICQDFMEYNKPHPAVVFFDIMEHLPDPQAGLKKAYDLVVPGGRLFISTPRNDHLGVDKNSEIFTEGAWNDGKPSGHLRLWTEEEFKDILKPYEVREFVTDITNNMLVEVEKK